MVGLPYDCLTNPLGAVRLTFEKALASGNDPASFDGKDWGAIPLFDDFLFLNGGLSQVPILNSASMQWLQSNVLVRFRGMIQDMLGNELYVGAFKDGSSWRTNKFKDISESFVDTSDKRIWERRLLYCVPIPGTNPWTKSSSEAAVNQSRDWPFQHREKRQREHSEANGLMDMAPHEVLEDSPNAKKIKENGDFSSSSLSEGSIPSMETEFDKEALPCLVKIYDSPESELKLNEVFEFFGVVNFDLDLTDDKGDSGDFSNDLSEDMVVCSSAGKVPRLHCLIYRKLEATDFLSNSIAAEPKLHLVKEARKALLGHLTAILGNDGLTAHFMLLHLLSRVNARVDSIAVGKFSLNLTSFSKEAASVFGNRFNLVVKDLLPFTHYIPLTIEYLNTATLVPKKDYQINRLNTGFLQLAEGSHLTIDETKLEAGMLNSVGVDNARLLKKLIELQKVEYDFQYYKMDMAADVKLLILSEAKSNILPADLVVPFCPSSVISTGDVAPEALEAWRWYLATLRLLPHTIDLEMQKIVENDLVAARQADRNLGTKDLSRWVTMGRLMSVSFGETSLSLEHWQMVKEMERLRKERLK